MVGTFIFREKAGRGYKFFPHALFQCIERMHHPAKGHQRANDILP